MIPKVRNYVQKDPRAFEMLMRLTYYSMAANLLVYLAYAERYGHDSGVYYGSSETLFFIGALCAGALTVMVWMYGIFAPVGDDDE